jgi:RNA polymerase sigma-70 factor (ECF subfamily)
MSELEGRQLLTSGSSEDSTRGLFRRARAGDSEARDLLWRRLIPRLQRFAHGRLPRGARGLLDTDDLVQDVLMKTLRGVERFDPHHSGALGGYLRDALLNRIRDEARRLGRRPVVSEAVSEPIAADLSPIEEAIEHEEFARYERAMLRITEGERELIHCRIELGLGFSDIARLLDKPSPDAARVATSRAVARLAREMMERPSR